MRESAPSPGELGGAVLVRPRREVGQSAVMKRSSVKGNESQATRARVGQRGKMFDETSLKQESNFFAEFLALALVRLC